MLKAARPIVLNVVGCTSVLPVQGEAMHGSVLRSVQFEKVVGELFVYTLHVEPNMLISVTSFASPLSHLLRILQCHDQGCDSA